MATIEHGATILSKLRDLAGAFRKIQADLESETLDPPCGVRFAFDIRAAILQVECAGAISTASKRGLLTDVPGLDTLVHWHADIEKNEEPLPPGTHSRLVRCPLNLFWQIHDEVLAKLEPGLFREQDSAAMVRHHDGKSFAVMDNSRAYEDIGSAVGRMHRIEELMTSATLCEWFAETLQAQQSGVPVNGENRFEPATWYAKRTDDALYPNLLRRARLDGRIAGEKHGGRWRYKVQSVCDAYPEYRRKLESGRESTPKPTESHH